jgi:hypothetical protein
MPMPMWGHHNLVPVKKAPPPPLQWLYTNIATADAGGCAETVARLTPPQALQDADRRNFCVLVENPEQLSFPVFV